MRQLTFSCIVACAAMVGWAAPSPGPLDHEIVPLRSGVYLIRRPDPMRQPVAGNMTVIVNELDVVVVDAGAMPIAAENAIALIRSVTDKPVSVLVNTHWHGDHNLGNQVFRARFPGIRIVSHESTRRSMLGKAMGDVTKYHEQLDDFLKQWIEPISRSAWLEASGKPILQDDVNTNN